ncbi:hypothetical protein FHL15_006220 [Xylaria flabelliformis]|uniref:Uncharacterized protein n=1 Tax=Xylaria flabelliformis TaxID=2512241 RepID=A0A553HXY2_9PEZI|nr:hypothetical protein FHL15_006220 [Xylaria flabelliformis]
MARRVTARAEERRLPPEEIQGLISELISSNEELNERLNKETQDLEREISKLTSSNKELTDQLEITGMSNQNRIEIHGTHLKRIQELEAEIIRLKAENDWVKKAFTEEKERSVQAREEILSVRAELKELQAQRDEENQKNLDWLRDNYSNSKKRKASPE